MRFFEALSMAGAAIWAHKLRSFLTLLGVIFGVATVIFVVTLIEGFNKYVDEKVADMGSNATPQKAGYNFTLGPGAGSAAGPNDCNGQATITAYYATAVPATFGSSGSRSFAVNQGNVVFELNAATAPTEPLGPPAKPVN